MRKTIRAVLQRDQSDCGPACLTMVAQHFGLKSSIESMRVAAGSDRRGTTLKGVLDAAQSCGLRAEALKAEEATSVSDIPLPFVAHTAKDDHPHFVVVAKASRRGITVLDPAVGRRRLSLLDFLEEWSGYFVVFDRDQVTHSEITDNTLSRFLRISVSVHGRDIALAIGASMLITALGILSASYYRVLVDTILPSGARSTLTAVSIGLIMVAVFRAIVRAIRGRILLGFSARVDVDLADRFLTHLFDLPFSFFELRRTGDVISRVADLSKIQQSLSQTLFEVVFDLAMVVFIATFLVFLDPVLFLASSVILFCSVLVGLAVAKPYSRLHKKVLERTAASQDYIIEQVQNMHIVKSYDAKLPTLSRAIERLVESRRASFRTGNLANMQAAISGVIEGVGIAIVFWVGSSRVLAGEFTLGSLIAFNALLAYFYGPILGLVGAQSTFQRGIEAARRATEILDLPTEDTTEYTPIALNGDISFDSVEFGYGSRANCLHSISIRIPKASWVSIVGPSGSGKSTIAKLLLRFYEPRSGSISVGDYRLTDIPVRSLRSAIGYVNQDSTLISGTICENIAYGAADATMAEIIRASKLAGAHEFINKLPDGYSTEIGESGVGLSGGERQRIAISRALFKDPDIVILDEATSNLDVESELLLLDSLANLRNYGKTVVSVAHRIKTAQASDIIVFVSAGQVCDVGHHKELLSRNRDYRRLWGTGRSAT